MDCLFLMVPLMDYGGQERFVATLSHILKDDYDVKIIVFDAYKIGYEVDCPIIELPKLAKGNDNNLIARGVNFIRKYRAMRKLYNEYSPVACVSFGNGANRFNVLSRSRKSKCGVSIRGYAAAERYLTGFIDKYIIKKSSFVIGVSEEICDALRGIQGIQKEKIYLLYNAYDVERIRKKAMQKKLSSTDSYIHLVSMGRINESKGYWHLIRVVAGLQSEKKNIKLDIYGIDENGNTEKYLQMANRMGISDCIRFCGNTDAVYETMGKYDIYVLSSIVEGFPNALVEAMACGLPVVANDCLSGPKEILGYTSNEPIKEYICTNYGMLTPRLSKGENYGNLSLDNEEKQMVRALSALIDDSSLRAKLAIGAVNRARTFSFDACRKRFKEIVEKS